MKLGKIKDDTHWEDMEQRFREDSNKVKSLVMLAKKKPQFKSYMVLPKKRKAVRI